MSQTRWDDYDAYLFDIDGTLLTCGDAVHYFAFCHALGNIAGRPLNLDGVTAHGNTDVGILRDALLLAGIPDHAWRPELIQIQKTMGRFVEGRRGELLITVQPAVQQVLDHLNKQGAALGVATGNLEQIGRIKLGHCGLLQNFTFAAYSDNYEYRADVFRSGLERARELLGRRATVCVIGDTPEDVRAAQMHRLDVIAVATGIYGVQQLQAESPTWCVHTLQDLFDM